MNLRHDNNIVKSVILAEHDRQQKLIGLFSELLGSEEWTSEQQRKLHEFKREILYG